MDDVLLLSNALLSSRVRVFLNCLSRFLGVLCCRTAVSANHVLRCQKGSNSRRPLLVAILQSVQLVSWPDPNIAHLERINHHLAALFAARWVQMTGLACDLPSFVEGVLFHWESLGRSGCYKSDSNVLRTLNARKKYTMARMSQACTTGRPARKRKSRWAECRYESMCSKTIMQCSVTAMNTCHQVCRCG